MQNLAVTLSQYISQLSKTKSQAFFLGLGLLLTLVIGTIDYLVSLDISMAIFYLIPISLTSWFTTRRLGLTICFISAISWFIAELVANDYYHKRFYFWNTLVIFIFFVTTSYLIAALKVAYDREKLLARTDSLTGAVNRRFFLEQLQSEIERAYRYGNHLTLAYIDIDDFKLINDGLGHSAGDNLLQKVVEVIKNQVRTTDIVARMGGDEFALLLTETDFDAAQIVLQRVNKQLVDMLGEQNFSANLKLGFSIGAVTFIALPISAAEALELTDRLMYSVKKSGKSRLEHEIFSKVI